MNMSEIRDFLNSIYREIVIKMNISIFGQIYVLDIPSTNIK